jgi:hypothetical protein
MVEPAARSRNPQAAPVLTAGRNDELTIGVLVSSA